MKKSLIALAFGTLGLGIAEFVMMAILPYVAADLHISIPIAGHLISAYALGVCAGAPLLTLARKLPLKNILLGLVAIMMVGNIFASLSPNYWTMLVARFISGLPHGAYFGVASVVAEKLADKGKGSEAVSIMIARHDHRQPLRSPVRNIAQHVVIVETHIHAGRSMGYHHTLLHLEMGSPSRRTTRYRVQRAIPFLENRSPVAYFGSYHVGKRRRILLV